MILEANSPANWSRPITISFSRFITPFPFVLQKVYGWIALYQTGFQTPNDKAVTKLIDQFVTAPLKNYSVIGHHLLDVVPYRMGQDFACSKITRVLLCPALLSDLKDTLKIHPQRFGKQERLHIEQAS